MTSPAVPVAGRIALGSLLAAVGVFALWLGVEALSGWVRGAGGPPHEALAFPVAVLLFAAAWGAFRGRRVAVVNDPMIAAALSYGFGALLLAEAAWVRRSPGADWITPAVGAAVFLALGAWKSRRPGGAPDG